MFSKYVILLFGFIVLHSVKFKLMDHLYKWVDSYTFIALYLVCKRFGYNFDTLDSLLTIIQTATIKRYSLNDIVILTVWDSPNGIKYCDEKENEIII